MKRFFAPDSFWNTPIPGNVEIDSESEYYISLLEKEPFGPFGINIYQWTIPVYEIDSSTPRHTVHLRVHREEDLVARKSKWIGVGDRFGHGPGFGEGVPIPDNASPDPEGDSHMAIIDWEQGLAWDMWGARRREDGEWESNTGMVYPIGGDGIFRLEDFPIKDEESIHFYGPSRAAGTPAIAGLIMHHEVEAGRIEHKLAAATRYNAYKKFTFPACWTDGRLDGGIPEGAIIQLDPSLDLDSFGLSRGGMTVARAMQEYGAVIVDASSGNSLYGEGLWHQDEKHWEGLLDPFDLVPLGMKHYRVLKIGETIQSGDARRGGNNTVGH